MRNFEGVFPILNTTFLSDGRLDLDSQQRLVDHLLAAGAHGMGLFGQPHCTSPPSLAPWSNGQTRDREQDPVYHPPPEKHSWRFLGQADERAERVCRSDRNHVFDRYASARSGQDQARLKAILEKEAAARISPLTHFALWDQLTDFTSRVDR